MTNLSTKIDTIRQRVYTVQQKLVKLMQKMQDNIFPSFWFYLWFTVFFGGLQRSFRGL